MKAIVTLGIVLATPVLTLGAAGYTLTVGGSGPSGATTIDVNPGDSFTIDLGMTQDGDGVSGFDGALTASANDTFYITARSWHLDDVDVNVVDATWLNDTNKWLKTAPDPQQNFGAIRATDAWPSSVFPAAIATLTVVASATAAPGSYTLTIGDPGTQAVIYDSSGEEQMPLSLGVLTVTVQSGSSGGDSGGGDTPPDVDDTPPDDDSTPPDDGDDSPPDDDTPVDDGSGDSGSTNLDNNDMGGSDANADQDGNGSTDEGTNANPQVVPAPVVCGPGTGGAFVLATTLGLGLIGRYRRRY